MTIADVFSSLFAKKPELSASRCGCSECTIDELWNAIRLGRPTEPTTRGAPLSQSQWGDFNLILIDSNHSETKADMA